MSDSVEVQHDDPSINQLTSTSQEIVGDADDNLLISDHHNNLSLLQITPDSTSIDNQQLSENTQKKCPSKKVSFPTDDTALITGYLEPANPWQYAQNVNLNDLILSYKKSCEHYLTEPLEKVIQQLQKLDPSNGRCDELNLKNEYLDRVHCEPLEEILKRVQFIKIDLESTSLNDESAETLFDMFEYYESARHVNISSNGNIGARGWQACSQMIKKTQCLEQLDAKDIVLTQQHINILKRPLQLVSHLQVLKLENCGLAGRAFVILVSALKLNTGLKELYLADNHLEKYDAIQLSGLLKVNKYLQLLDISNNNIQDGGVRELLDGIISQSTGENIIKKGLSILIMWNNNFTRDSSGNFADTLAKSKTLETLNIGKNNMGDEFLEICKEALKSNKTLLQLGMQSTGLLVKGILALAEAIEANETLQRIDLRDNSIQLTGLTFLCLALKKNTYITQIDLDDTTCSKSTQQMVERYSELVEEIRGYCSRNEESYSSDESTEELSSPEHRSRLSSMSSRKISLTCHSLPRSPPILATELANRTTLLETKRTGGRLRSPAPSPIPSPVASPIPSPSRSRFLVSRVSESSLSSTNSSASSSPLTPPNATSSTCFFPSTNSRFRVTIVQPTSFQINSDQNIVNNNNNQQNQSESDQSLDLKESDSEVSSAKQLEILKDEVLNEPNQRLNEVIEEKRIGGEVIIEKPEEELIQVDSSPVKYMTSLERLLGLFQKPKAMLTNTLERTEKKRSPFYGGVSSMMALGDRFQQYLREGRISSELMDPTKCRDGECGCRLVGSNCSPKKLSDDNVFSVVNSRKKDSSVGLDKLNVPVDKSSIVDVNDSINNDNLIVDKLSSTNVYVNSRINDVNVVNHLDSDKLSGDNVNNCLLSINNVNTDDVFDKKLLDKDDLIDDVDDDDDDEDEESDDLIFKISDINLDDDDHLRSNNLHRNSQDSGIVGDAANNIILINSSMINNDKLNTINQQPNENIDSGISCHDFLSSNDENVDGNGDEISEVEGDDSNQDLMVNRWKNNIILTNIPNNSIIDQQFKTAIKHSDDNLIPQSNISSTQS